MRPARRLLCLPLVAVLAATSVAQFSQLDWTFSSPKHSGSGQITGETMYIVGPDELFGDCAGASTNAFMAVAPYALTVVADYTCVNDDKLGCCADFFVTIVDAVETEVNDSCYGCRVVLSVPAGSTFGFGIHTIDCNAGSAGVTLTNLQILPVGQVVSVDGVESGEQLGTSVAGAGDLDGDSVPDFAVGAPLADLAGTDSGRVTVRSGADGSTLVEWNGVAAGDRFGQALDGGDVDGDGLTDLIVGAPGSDAAAADAGELFVFSGADGRPLLAVTGDAAGDQLGSAVAFVGDVDGDGRGDVLVGAPLHDAPGADGGQARLVSGADGSTRHAWVGAAAGDELGRSVAGAGDVDADGWLDVIIGAPKADPLASESGRAFVYSGRDGSQLQVLTQQPCGADDFDHFGQAVAGLGDVDGDGLPDVAVGCPDDGCNGSVATGSVWVYSGATGELLREIQGRGGEYRFGAALDSAGDVDGDGVPDLVAGTPSYSVCCPTPAGRAYVYSGADGELLYAYTEGELADRFGMAVAGLGDVDGDGLDDVVVGAPRSDAVASDAGRAVLTMGSLLWADLGQAGSQGIPTLAGQGLLAPGLLIALGLTSVAVPGPTALVIGFDQLDAPFKGGVLVPSPDFALVGLPTTPHGFGLQALWPSGVPSGFQLFFQMWTVDAGAPAGLSASNGLRATTP